MYRVIKIYATHRQIIRIFTSLERAENYIRGKRSMVVSYKIDRIRGTE